VHIIRLFDVGVFAIDAEWLTSYDSRLYLVVQF
jgi:hypothetical protein